MAATIAVATFSFIGRDRRQQRRVCLVDPSCIGQRTGLRVSLGGASFLSSTFFSPSLSLRCLCKKQGGVVPIGRGFAIYTISSMTKELYLDKAPSPLKKIQRLFTGAKKAVSNTVDLNYWIVRNFSKLVAAVNALEQEMQSLSDEQLRAKTDEFRERLRQGETLDTMKAEAFAVVREAARRTLGMRHFDVQIIGGAVLHDGAVAEMKTGEGKTLVSPLPAYLNALSGRGVHVVTVNDYLAQRDAEWMGRIHRFLGLSVGLVQGNMSSEERKNAYACDITYANNTELGFDYLRDSMQEGKEDLVLRWPDPFHYAIVDEVDSVLIDEGRNPLLISNLSEMDTGKYPVAAKVAELLKTGRDYKVDQKDKSVDLTEEGVLRAEMALGTEDLWDEKDNWGKYVLTAIKAKELFQLNVHYIVRDEKVQIVDEFTGRVQPNRRWSADLHQAVEAKEGVEVQPDSMTAAQITYQSFFRLYSKLSGMTGTAKTEESELLRIFKLPTVVIPTNLPNIRQDLPMMIFTAARGKWFRVASEVLDMHEQGRPVLVGTTSVEQSEYLSWLLQEWGIPHNLLNARPEYAAKEAEIIAQAGRKGAITISTNMAGRGTDIILGGNPAMLARQIVEKQVLPMLCPYTKKTAEPEAPLSQELTPVELSPTSEGLLARCRAAARTVYFHYVLTGAHKEEGLPIEEAKRMIGEACVSAGPLSMSAQESAIGDEEVNGNGSGTVNGNGGATEGRKRAESVELWPMVARAYASVMKSCEEHCRKEGKEVKALGGLHVIGTELHESRRIDNQLRGRAGRQGDPGSSRFMISLEDENLRLFAGEEWLRHWLPKLGVEEDMPIQGKAIENQILKVQEKMEKYHNGLRKELLEYDEVLEVQRRHVYELRQTLLMEDWWSRRERLYQYLQACVDETVAVFTDPKKPPSEWDLAAILNDIDELSDGMHQSLLGEIRAADLLRLLESSPDPFQPSDLQPVSGQQTSTDADVEFRHPFPVAPSFPGTHQSLRSLKSRSARIEALLAEENLGDGKWRPAVQKLRAYLGDVLVNTYEGKLAKANLPYRTIVATETAIALRAMDFLWQEHLDTMSRLRHSVSVRSFGHLNPLEEYKIDGCRFFINLLSTARRRTVAWLLSDWQYRDQDVAEMNAF